MTDFYWPMSNANVVLWYSELTYWESTSSSFIWEELGWNIGQPNSYWEREMHWGIDGAHPFSNNKSLLGLRDYWRCSNRSHNNKNLLLLARDHFPIQFPCNAKKYNLLKLQLFFSSSHHTNNFGLLWAQTVVVLCPWSFLPF